MRCPPHLPTARLEDPSCGGPISSSSRESSQIDLCRYSLAFSDDKLSKSWNKRLIEFLLSMPPFSAAKIATDWNQKLVSLVKLELHEKYIHCRIPSQGRRSLAFAHGQWRRRTGQCSLEEHVPDHRRGIWHCTVKQVSNFFKKVKVETNRT